MMGDMEENILPDNTTQPYIYCATELIVVGHIKESVAARDVANSAILGGGGRNFDQLSET